MRLVLIESPYASPVPGGIDRNVAYVRAAMADCLRRNEACFASHALYTLPGVLDDTKPEERALGIAAGLAWGAHADATVVYCDLGVSRGMQHGIDRAVTEGRPVEMRKLPADVLQRVMAVGVVPTPPQRVVHLTRMYAWNGGPCCDPIGDVAKAAMEIMATRVVMDRATWMAFVFNPCVQRYAANRAPNSHHPPMTDPAGWSIVLGLPTIEVVDTTRGGHVIVSSDNDAFTIVGALHVDVVTPRPYRMTCRHCGCPMTRDDIDQQRMCHHRDGDPCSPSAHPSHKFYACGGDDGECDRCECLRTSEAAQAPCVVPRVEPNEGETLGEYRDRAGVPGAHTAAATTLRFAGGEWRRT